MERTTCGITYDIPAEISLFKSFCPMESIHLELIAKFETKLPIGAQETRWQKDYEAPDAIEILEEHSEAYIEDIAKDILWGICKADEDTELDFEHLKFMRETSNTITDDNEEPIGYLAFKRCTCPILYKGYKNGTAKLEATFTVIF